MTKVSANMVLFQSLRMFLYYKLCKFVKDKAFQNVGKNLTLSKLFALFVFLGGTAIYHLISGLVDWVMCKMWKLHTLGPFDDLFLVTENDAESNVAITVRFEKFDP